MAYVRLFRRIRIAPGLTLNLAKHGPSLSAGFRGAHITAGRNGIRRTVGVPGTGVYWTSQRGYHSGVHTGEHFHNGDVAPPTGPATRNAAWLVVLCTFLGLFGVHRFYAGRYISGLVMLVLTFTGYGVLIVLPWWAIDWILSVAGRFHDRHGNRIRW